MIAVLMILGVSCSKMHSQQPAATQSAPAPIAAVAAVTPPPASAPTTPSAASPSASDVLAKVNGVPISDADVTERVKSRLSKLESQIFDIKISGVDDMIEEKLGDAFLGREAGQENYQGAGFRVAGYGNFNLPLSVRSDL